MQGEGFLKNRQACVRQPLPKNLFRSYYLQKKRKIGVFLMDTGKPSEHHRYETTRNQTMINRRPVSRVKACRKPKPSASVFHQGWFFIALVGVFLVMILGVTSARAQFPRIGFSAAADSFVGNLDVVQGEEFTLHVCIFGVDDQTPLEQEFLRVGWVIYQTCCGANISVVDAQFSPDFQHHGGPVLGVESIADDCVDEPYIHLATLTLVMNAPENGIYQASCGPLDTSSDCEGNNPLMLSLPMELNVTGSTTPTESQSWDQLKSFFR
jgi:hypothetical protein